MTSGNWLQKYEIVPGLCGGKNRYFYAKENKVSLFNTELFIARRIFSAKGTSRKFSESIVSFAVFGIAFGLFVMILSVAIVTGFKKEVRNKVIGFGSHIQIVNFDSNSSYETVPVSKDQIWLQDIKKIKGIKSIQSFATKPGIVKTDNEIHGIVLKGVGSDFDWSFFKENLVEGTLFTVSDSVKTDDVLISKQIALLLKLKVGDPLFTYFLNEETKAQKMRKFKICGIYSTSLEEFDQLFVLADISHVQKLNDWKSDQISGFEIAINDFNDLDLINREIRQITLSYSKDNESVLRPVTITSKYPQIFDWLNLLDMNVWIILALIILVAGFNMVSGLLILILERTTMIGVLKAVGTGNWSIRKIFIYISSFLIFKGMFWGNLAGIAFCLIQSEFGVFKLDPGSYYLDTVPVNLKITHLLLLNAGTIIITLLMLLVPSWYVSRIEPDKAIKFD
ncbi:MAG TPA: FtsX-like permease family protein [Paludibacter sp.]